MDSADVEITVTVIWVSHGQTEITSLQRVFLHQCAVAVKLPRLVLAVLIDVDAHGFGFTAAPLHSGVFRQLNCALEGQLERLCPLLHFLLVN